MEERKDTLELPTECLVIPCEIEGEMKLCQVKYYRPNWLNQKYPRANGLLGEYYFCDVDDGHYIVVGMSTIMDMDGRIKPQEVRAFLMCVTTGAVCLRTIRTKQVFQKTTNVRIEGDDLLKVRDRIFKEEIS